MSTLKVKLDSEEVAEAFGFTREIAEEVHYHDSHILQKLGRPHKPCPICARLKEVKP